MLRLFAILLPFFSGCYFTRSPSDPVAATWFLGNTSGGETQINSNGYGAIPTSQAPYFLVSSAPENIAASPTSSCLFVLMPGFLDTPDTYERYEFPRRVRAITGCDSVAVDAHYRYYSGNVADVVYRDIIFPAERRGYRSIWLVGISMGGMGSLMVAAQHPDAISGLLLLSPHLGENHVLESVRNAGGLAAWQPNPEAEGARMAGWSERNYSERVWAWLRGYADPNAQRPPLYIVWGDSDRLREPCEMVAAVLDEDRVGHEEGGHNWATWTPLFESMLTRLPIRQQQTD